ncbi:hypothetical protein MTR_4g133415 [Medicago truncatula]|uniref:Uncharacterized protein n=1 Tax=Medicago truncatula TaxID=3880 RepID=A0A072UUA5_MEDTR|nr:hypothetical protein MTR_4g133415 [Medicago truncatula]
MKKPINDVRSYLQKNQGGRGCEVRVSGRPGPRQLQHLLHDRCQVRSCREIYDLIAITRVTGDDGDGWYGRRENFGDDETEEIVDEDHARVVVLCPVDVITLEKNLPVCGGDEGGGGGGLLTDMEEGEFDL